MLVRVDGRRCRWSMSMMDEGRWRRVSKVEEDVEEERMRKMMKREEDGEA